MKILIFMMLCIINAHAELFITPDVSITKSMNDETRFIVKDLPIQFEFNHQDIDNQLVLDIQLTDEIKVKAIRFKIEHQGVYTIWTGRITNDPYGKLIIVYNKESIAIELTTGGNHYWLMQKDDGYHLVQSVSLDESFIVKKTQDYIESRPDDVQNKSQITTKSSNKFIDVLLLYTDDVKSHDANIETVLTARVATINQILEDSCVNFRYRLVHMAEVNYVETGSMQTDLNCIYAWTDGCLDNIHTLRDTYGADLFQMITYSGDYCGRAHVNSVDNFQTVKAASIAGYLCDARTMAHELGHNLGLQHDRYETGNKPHETVNWYREGYGWVDMANKQRSIMSYNDQCTANGFSCTRLYQFSSPKINHKGLPFGEAGFSDSVQYMNKYFGYVANFVDAKTSYSPSINNNCVAAGDEKDIHCFIATAAFGSYMQEDVLVLREFRDKYLRTNFMGQKFIDIYYEYSPYLAHYISQNMMAKSVSKAFVKVISFIVSHSIEIFFSVVLLAIFTFFGFKGFVIGFILLSLIETAKADVAVPSLFSNYQSVNPASRFLVKTPMMLAINYEKIKKNGSANNMDFKSEGSKINMLFGVYSPQFFFDFDFYNKTKLKKTIAAKGLADSDSNLETGERRLQVGSVFSFFGPIGFKYHSKKIKDSEGQKDKEVVTLGLGTIALWNGLRVGYGFDLVSEKGENIAAAKWLDLYFGIAGGSFSGESGTVFEYNFHRSPKVLQTDNTYVNVHPEVWSHTFIFEMAGTMIDFINLNKFRASLAFEQQKKVDIYFEDEVKKTELGFRLGGNIFQTTNYTFDYTAISSNDQTKDKETRIKYSLYWGFGGAAAVAAE